MLRKHQPKVEHDTSSEEIKEVPSSNELQSRIILQFYVPKHLFQFMVELYIDLEIIKSMSIKNKFS